MLEHSNNHSVLAYIVPATFLEAESYKYARKYIVEHFSSAWIVPVDADARAGIRSDSMFRTQQGRAIFIAIRKFGETSAMSEYRYFDISRLSKDKKTTWLEQDADVSLQKDGKQRFTQPIKDLIEYVTDDWCCLIGGKWMKFSQDYVAYLKDKIDSVPLNRDTPIILKKYSQAQQQQYGILFLEKPQSLYYQGIAAFCVTNVLLVQRLLLTLV